MTKEEQIIALDLAVDLRDQFEDHVGCTETSYEKFELLISLLTQTE